MPNSYLSTVVFFRALAFLRALAHNLERIAPRVRSQSPAQQHLCRRNVSDFELGKSSLGKVAADIQLGEMNLRKVFEVFIYSVF
jgi:hypothetical protein